MDKCNCRVCKVGRWVREEYGKEAANDWLEEGFQLEGTWIIAEENYNKHFVAGDIMEKYNKWPSLKK